MGKFSQFTGADRDESPSTALARSGGLISNDPQPSENSGEPKAPPGKSDTTELARVGSGAISTPGDPSSLDIYREIGNEQGNRMLVGRLKELNIAILLDATGSMQGLINNAKSNIKEMMGRLLETNTDVKIKLAVYRDYCDGQRAIFEASPLSDGPGELYQWLDPAEADGGGDYPEAIEYALSKLVGQGFHMVVVCGDAPSHSEQEIDKQTKQYGFPTGEAYTAVHMATRLRQEETPVHMLVVGKDQRTIADFKKIAEAGGGEQGELDESSAFLDMILMAAHHRAGGDDAVRDYIFKHGKALSPGAERFSRALVKYQGGPSAPPGRC